MTNGGFFNTTSTACIGNLVVDGKILGTSERKTVNFGMRDGKFVVGYVTPAEVLDRARPFEVLVSGLVWLVRNGVNNVADNIAYEEEYNTGQETGTGFVTVNSARTGLGHNKAGELMLLQMEGKTWERGMSLYQFADLLVELGAWNVINLDGGGSGTMSLNGM